ncbi:MAG: N-(5'-phosphoribosyl)anthranilate isomerase [Sulfitobacter sp.]|nr:N-(5'-phosphoribosyl)anthranilate isomerase [Sulfitobacter sp.]
MVKPAQMTPEHWTRHVFSAKAAQEGGVVRRKIRDIERYVGLEAFFAELDRRGFSAVENAGQLVIFCNREPVRLATRPAVSRSHQILRRI